MGRWLAAANSASGSPGSDPLLLLAMANDLDALPAAWENGNAQW